VNKRLTYRRRTTEGAKTQPPWADELASQERSGQGMRRPYKGTGFVTAVHVTSSDVLVEASFQLFENQQAHAERDRRRDHHLLDQRDRRWFVF
jgi:hypothetical protein